MCIQPDCPEQLREMEKEKKKRNFFKEFRLCLCSRWGRHSYFSLRVSAGLRSGVVGEVGPHGGLLLRAL